MNFSDFTCGWDDLKWFFGDDSDGMLPPGGWTDPHEPETWPAPYAGETVPSMSLAALAWDCSKRLEGIYCPIYGVTVDGAYRRNAAVHHVVWQLMSDPRNSFAYAGLSMRKVEHLTGVDHETSRRYCRQYTSWRYQSLSPTLLESTIWGLISELKTCVGGAIDRTACEDELDDIYRSLVSLDQYLLDRCAAVQRKDDPLRAIAFHVLRSYEAPATLSRRFRIPPGGSEADLCTSYKLIAEKVSGVERVSRILSRVLKMEVTDAST